MASVKFLEKDKAMPQLKRKELDKLLAAEDAVNEEISEEEFANRNKKDWSNHGSIQVLGLAVEKYLASGGRSYDEEEDEDIVAERYKLVVEDVKTKDKYTISLHKSFGFSTIKISRGFMKIERLDKEIPTTHIPTEPLIIKGFAIDGEDLSWHQSTIYAEDEKGNIARDKKGHIKMVSSSNEEDIDDVEDRGYKISNNVFSFVSHGSDIYYPSGWVKVNKELFTPLERAMENRPVWIIEGASGTGKSTLASHLQGLTVFETDTVDKLPDVIKADVVVLGNRSRFNRSEVTSRLYGQPNVDLISVSFQKERKQRDYLQDKLNAVRSAAKKNHVEMGKTGEANGEKTAEVQTKAALKEMRNHRVVSAASKILKDNQSTK
jgi:hypothetical protein